MNDERVPRLERLLGSTARRFSGGQLHPLELLQRVQSAAEATVRDGVVANDYLVTLNPADHRRYARLLDRLGDELDVLLEELERRNGWRRIGGRHIAFAQSEKVDSGLPAVSGRFVELRHAGATPPPGATRKITRHRNVVLRLSDGTAVPLTHTPFVIGRAAGNDLVLPVLSVSRRHAEIVRTAEGLVIRDLGSRNGIVVDSVRVDEYPLQRGGMVELGDIQFRLEQA